MYLSSLHRFTGYSLVDSDIEILRYAIAYARFARS